MTQMLADHLPCYRSPRVSKIAAYKKIRFLLNSQKMEKETEKPVSDKKVRKGNVLFLMASYIWLPVSFILPFLFTHHMASQNYVADMPGRSKFTQSPAQWRVDEARSEALRSGVLGMVVALTILFLWRLDKVIVKDRRELNNTWMVVVLGCFAVLLWTVWTCAGHLVLRASDEINSAPAQLPGLDSGN
jgi:hypothetical protein